MPTVLKEKGYRFFFYSKEGNEPPHIHVKGHGGEMKIWIEPMIVKKVYRLSPRRQREINSIVKKNREMFLSEWRRYHG